MAEPLVIVGAGQAAAQLVTSLAQDGFKGAITIVGDEPHPPYQRPPLSKKFLSGEIALDRLYLKPASFYEKAGAVLRLGTRVQRIDRGAREIVLGDGGRLPYATLVLATGSRPRRLALPGADLAGIFYLRSIADVAAIRAQFGRSRSLAVVGGGYIGLELAAVAARQGLAVRVFEQAPRLMARGVGPIISDFYARLHLEEGVQIHTAATVLGFEGNDAVERVVCQGGSCAADIVAIGTGALPNAELATEAGLATEDGILIDAACRTDDPSIYAIGDCTSQYHALAGRRLRLESVHNALEQARIAAAAICGRPLPAVGVPWFWSDQYDVKLQMAGLSAGHDKAVLRGDPQTGRSFAVFYFRGEALIGVDAVNRAPEFMVSRQLIGEGAKIDPQRLGDERLTMKDMTL